MTDWWNGVVGWVGGLLDGAITLVQSVDPGWRILFAGVGMLLETSILVGLVVPGDTIVLVASTGITQPWEYAATLAAVIVGSLTGESIGYLLGSTIGHPLRRSRVGRWLGESNWARAERYVAHRGGWAILISRFLPVLHALVPLTAGMAEFRYRRFLAWTAPACIVWASAYVTVGMLAGASYRELSRQLTWAGVLFAAVLALFLGMAFLVRRAIHRREARHLDAAGPQPDRTEDPANTDTATDSAPQDGPAARD